MYIFLDVDGLLNKKSDWETFYCLNTENIDNLSGFSKKDIKSAKKYIVR